MNRLALAFLLALPLAACQAEPAPVAVAVAPAPTQPAAVSPMPATPVAPVAPPVEPAPPPMPLDPSFVLDGASMADLSAQWWQWAMSAPEQGNPVVDLTGEHCAVNQDGPAWFLAGAFGSAKVRRTCQVPAGKYVFFPAINMVYFPNPGVTDVTCAMAQGGAALNNDTALDVFVQLDGVFVDDTQRHRVRTSECFDVYARVPEGRGPGSAYPSASDGFWFLLPPLPPGEHKLKFGGRYNSYADEYGGMVQDIEYRLIVE